MACRVNLVKSRSSGCIGERAPNNCKGGGGGFIARGSTSPNSTRHIHCFNKHQTDNNKTPAALYATSSSANKPLTQLQNSVPQDWALTNTAAVTVLSNVEGSISNSEDSFQAEDKDNPMAGDIRIVDGKTTGRKHWALRDRSTMSVHFLKANLAEDGCEEAQLDIAKKLLQDSKDPDLLDSAQKENSRLAIYWLVKSSEQGNLDATKLLKECLDSGHGITAQNLPDVMTCINTPTNEKLTYKASRLLYLKLNNGEKFITTTQLLLRIQSLNRKVVHFSDEEVDPNSNKEDSNKEDSLNGTFVLEDEESFTNAPLNETFTYQPSQNRSQPHHEEITNEKNKSELFHINYSNQEGVKLTMEDLLKSATSFNSGESPKPAIDRNHAEMERHYWKLGSQFNAFCFQLLILCAITQGVSIYFCILCASSFLSVWASFNLIGWKKRHLNFKDWSKAFGSIIRDENHVWSDQEAENRLVGKSLIPNLCALIFSTVSFIILDDLSTITLVNGVLVIYTLLCCRSNFTFSTLRLTTFVAILNFPVIASYCLHYAESEFNLEIVMGYLPPWWMDILKTTLHGIDVSSLGDHHWIPVTQSIVIVPLLVGSWQHMLKKTLAELLTALWLTQTAITINELQNDIQSIGIGLLISAIVITIIMIIHSQLDHLKMTLYLGIVIIVGALSFTLIAKSLQDNNYIRTLISNFQLSKDQIIVKGIPNIDSLPHLEWDQYDMDCNRKAWKVHNPAYTQLFCFSKYGKAPSAVRWRGRVSVVKIREMLTSVISPSVNDVTFDIILNLIPSGTSSENSPSPSSWQQYLPGGDQQQHPAPAVVLVSTTKIIDANLKQRIMNFVSSLHAGDKIEFYGVLNPLTIGGLRPEIIHLQSIKCVHCAASSEEEEFFLHNDNRKSHRQTVTQTKHTTSDQSLVSLLNQLKKLFIELVDVVKEKSEFIFL